MNNVDAPGLDLHTDVAMQVFGINTARDRFSQTTGLTFRSNSRKSRQITACELATTGIDCYGRDHSLPLHRVVISSSVSGSHASSRIIRGCVPSHFVVFFSFLLDRSRFLPYRSL